MKFKLEIELDLGGLEGLKDSLKIADGEGFESEGSDLLQAQINKHMELLE